MIAIKFLIICSLMFLLARSITKAFVSSVKDAYIEGKTPPPKNSNKQAKKTPQQKRKFMGGEEIEFEEVD